MRTIDAMKKLARNDGRFTHVSLSVDALVNGAIIP